LVSAAQQAVDTIIARSPPSTALVDSIDEEIRRRQSAKREEMFGFHKASDQL
jgi:hypothetical protein